MAGQDPTYSIVIPVYNSSTILPNLAKAITTALADLDYEVIMVNDGSDNNTEKALEQIHKEYGFRVVHLQGNYGQHLATLCGLRFAKGSFAITLDDDLQTHPSQIAVLLQKQREEQADLVYGVYPDKKHSTWRNVGSKLFTGLLHRSGSAPAKGSSFRCISKSLYEQITPLNHPFVYLDELLAWFTLNTAFVECEHQVRTDGKSQYNFFRLLKLSHAILVNYTTLPLQIITYLGLLSSVVSFGFGVYYIVQKYTVGAQLGFTSLIVAIFFSTGLILFSLGTIGQYLSRIYQLQNGKPAYRIKDVLA